VKRYSSGMYVRLGFAIAAHLDPEILLLDEVLAVGDAAFQAKCMQRIKELEENGTTIVFISHDLTAVERLCDRVVLMRHGRIAQEGRSRDVIREYHQGAVAPGASAALHTGAIRQWPANDDAPGNEIARLRSVRVRNREGQTTASIDIRRPVGIEVEYDVLDAGHVLIPNYHFINQDGLHVFSVQDAESEWRRRPRPIGRYVSTAWIPGNFMAAGNFSVDVAVSSHVPLVRVHALVQGPVAFEVVDSFEGDSARGDYMGEYPGVVRPIVDWSTEYGPSVMTESLPVDELAAS
jgi:lipopolysaccharide transport system ATP-binding protein